jgi:hypothetical protein
MNNGEWIRILYRQIGARKRSAFGNRDDLLSLWVRDIDKTRFEPRQLEAESLEISREVGLWGQIGQLLGIVTLVI